MARPPALVLCFGLHGSASTWVFNVARELMEGAAGAARVHPCHLLKPADLAREQARGAPHIVAKTHGWPGLAAFAREQGATTLVSCRDPRDAIVSLMQRFGDPFEPCLAAVSQECRALADCAAAGTPVLRYEDRFFADPATVGWVAGRLGIEVSATAAARIFGAYTTEAVRDFAQAVADLPDEMAAGSGRGRFDRLTQITAAHIGDGQVGKWRDRLDPAQQGLCTMVLGGFLRAIGYT